MPEKFATIPEGLAAAGLEGAHHHLFLCLGPDCAPLAEGEKTWDHLERRCRELGLPVMRTKAGCLRVCVAGPWLLVYPEGLWYSHVNPERLDRILQQHLVEGRPVAEWVQATHPLCRPNSP